MNLVDSSGWLEFFTDGKKADIFMAPLNDTKHLRLYVSGDYQAFLANEFSKT